MFTIDHLQNGPIAAMDDVSAAILGDEVAENK
jgi:hypothetical protein